MQDLVQTVVNDPGVRNSVLFAGSAIAGQILHVVKKWAEGEKWVFSNPRRTVAAIIGNISGIVAALTVAGVDNLTIAQCLAAGVTLGLSADSLLNKGTRKVWEKES